MTARAPEAPSILGMVRVLQTNMGTPRRLHRVFAESPIYFVTASTFEGRWILNRPDVHRAFVQFGLRGVDRGVRLGRYVLMPDHVHLFVSLSRQAPSLSVWKKSLKNAISKVLRLATISAPHWEKGFFDRVIRSDESYDQKWEYVRQNPVRAGLVRSAEDYPYAGELFQIK
jgi:putative transposase